MNKIFLTLLLFISAQLVFAADERFAGIETLMTTAEQRAAGIENLTPQQIEALNAWIARYAAGRVSPQPPVPRINTAPVAPAVPAVSTATTSQAPTDDFRKPPEKIDFVSRIDGKFEGWSGRTRFTLENGQVWEQRRGNRWKISLDSPEVHIRENFMGAFEMEVLSEGRSIGVRRIR